MTPAQRRIVLSVATACAASVTLVLAARAAIARGVFDGDAFRLLVPDALSLLGVIPLGLLFVLRSRAELSRKGLAWAVALRASLAACLVLALARPVRTTDATLTSTVVLVDVSPSVSDAALARATERVASLLRAREEHHVEIVTFARRPRRVALPTRPEELVLSRESERAPTTPGATRAEDPAPATDLGAAMRFAESLFVPGRLPRLWILSDGLETRGRALSAAVPLAQRGVRIFVTPFEGPIATEVAVTGIAFPEEIRAGQPFEVRVSVRASAPTRARVRLYQDGRLVGLEGVREVDLVAGSNEVAFRTVSRERGTVELRAEVEPLDEGDGDRFAENNRFVRAAEVIGRPRVLLLAPEPARLEGFARVLDAAEMDTDLRTARGLPASVGELAAFDAVVLADVPADQVSASGEALLETYVRRGGTLLMSGGPRAFGPGGWRGTQLERILPVGLDGERRRDTPALALALVIDRSGSMAGEKMELAKEAARATAEILSPDDALVVIGFDSVAERVVPLQSAANRLAIQRDIGRLAPRGGTSIFPALDAAYQDLSGSRAATRHVILLTDGQTNEPGIPQLVSAMRADGITVTSVGVGTDVNRALLSEVADIGGGRAYFTSDPSSIPRIFLREATTVGQNSVVEEYVRAEVVTAARFLRGVDLARAPLIRGYVATTARGAPSELVLRTELGDPLLARRAVGSGHTLAWTSDLQGRWSAELLRWSESPRLFGQLLREHTRADETAFLPLEARVEDDELVLRADAFDEDDRFLHDVTIHARVEGPLDAPPEARSTTELDLRPLAPGRYEARLPLTRFGAYAVDAVHAIAGVPYGTSRASPIHPYPREYERLEPDPALLDALALETGGRRIDDDVSPLVSHAPDERIEAHEELAPWWPGLALALLVLDVLVRRLLREA
ncbi:MAG: VWA domain-containing protein [Sandaracinaceae bacterium]